MGDGENNGGGGEENGGFLGEGGVKGIEKGLGWMGIGGSVLGGLDMANKISGAIPYASMLNRFAGGGMNTVSTLAHNIPELWSAGSEAAEAGHGILGPASKLMGPIGQVMGGVQAVADGAMVANDFSKKGFDGAYHDSNTYNHAGGAALGAAHAILPALGPYGMAADAALAGGEMAANLGGKAAGWAFGDGAKFNADSVAGGLIRGTFGDQSLGEKARQGIGNTFGHGTAANIAGWGADLAINSATLPMQLGTTVGRGIWNEGSAIVDSIANGKGAVGHALNSAGHWAADTASNAWHGATNFAGNAAHTIADGASNAWHGATNFASNTAHNIADGASNLWHSGTSAISNAGSTALNAVTHNPVSNAISSGVSKVMSW